MVQCQMAPNKLFLRLNGLTKQHGSSMHLTPPWGLADLSQGTEIKGDYSTFQFYFDFPKK